MALPFSPAQFFAVFGAYNRMLWPFALGLWVYALIGAIGLARSRTGAGRFLSVMLAIQWAWAAVAYHAMFFSTISPAAWLFAALFLAQTALFLRFGVIREQLRFSRGGGVRQMIAWAFIVAALLYPLLARAEGHVFPDAPTFGVPCPTTLMTVGLLFAADPPWPKSIAWIPILWALIGGSAALLLGVHTDLLLWIAALALIVDVIRPGARR